MANPERICSVPQCGKPVRSLGLCGAHYARQRRTGAPDGAVPRKRPKVIAWLEQAIMTETNECIVWPFAVGKGGYGNVRLHGKYTNAHRAVCLFVNGVPETGLEAAHLCGNKLCCNPKHIIWATRRENENHKIAHGTRLTGERVWNSVLSREDVTSIRRDWLSGSTVKDLAHKYDISRSHAWAVANATRWTWLE